MAQPQRQADVHQNELCPPNKRYALMDANKNIDLDNLLCLNESQIMANILQNHPLKFSIAASKSHDDFEAKQNEEKVKEHLMAKEIEKLVEGTENVENNKGVNSVLNNQEVLGTSGGALQRLGTISRCECLITRGENIIAKRKKMTVHGTYVFGESSSGQANESISPINSTSQTQIDSRAFLHNSQTNPQKPTLVVQSCQRDYKAPALSRVNQDLLYLKKGNSGPKKIVLSLHKFPIVIFPDDDIEEITPDG
ncbi:hypothetical protein Tco_0304329 [Tanacetum coccineum]